MINIREAAKKADCRLRLIAASDFLYDALSEMPDFYCSSIADFKLNRRLVRDGRSFELPHVRYFPKNGVEFELSDYTGDLTVQLHVDGSSISERINSTIDSCAGNYSIRERLRTLASGNWVHQVVIRKNKINQVLGFEMNSFTYSEKTKGEYLAWRFPEITLS